MIVNPKFIQVTYRMPEKGSLDQETAKVDKFPIGLSYKDSSEISELEKNGWKLRAPTPYHSYVTNESDHPLQLDQLFKLIYDLMKILEGRERKEVVTTKEVITKQGFLKKDTSQRPSFVSILEAYETRIKSGFPPKQVKVADFLMGNYGFEANIDRNVLFFKIEYD